MEKEKTKPTMRRHLILSQISKQTALIRRRSGNHMAVRRICSKKQGQSLMFKTEVN